MHICAKQNQIIISFVTCFLLYPVQRVNAVMIHCTICHIYASISRDQIEIKPNELGSGCKQYDYSPSSASVNLTHYLIMV